jgi:methylglyoxal synthase
MEKAKKIVLVAHDNRKADLLEWVSFNKGTLSGHFLSATGTTGKLIHEETGLPIIDTHPDPSEVISKLVRRLLTMNWIY